MTLKIKTGRKRTLFVVPGRTYKLAVPKKSKGKKQVVKYVVKEVVVSKKR